jgi:phage repressor protein C with HTH and peptisase S24 domain
MSEFIRICQFFKITESQILHTDLSIGGGYDKKLTTSKKQQKDGFEGGFEDGFDKKKYQKNSISTVANESENDEIIRHRMPQVITIDTQGNENVVMVPVRARAGYLNGYSDPTFIEKLPAYRLPGLNNGTFRLFEVEGLSMYPTLHGGDLIIGQNVEQLQDVRDDRVHVIITKNDCIVVKRVLNRIKKDNKLILKSDNYKDRDMYPSIVIDPVDVIEIWYAIGFISRQMRPPAEVYNRVIDLEGRLTIMEENIKKQK